MKTIWRTIAILITGTVLLGVGYWAGTINGILSRLLASSVVSQSTMRAANDMRFSTSFTNAYVLRLEKIIKRAHPDKQIALRLLDDIVKVGDTFIVSLSFALYGKGEAITEKMFLKIHPFFDPFLKEESDYYKNAGKVVTGVGYGGPIEERWADDYTNEKLPMMTFTIYGKEKNWFQMKIAYSDRKDDYTVVDFTIVAVE